MTLIVEKWTNREPLKKSNKKWLSWHRIYRQVFGWPFRASSEAELGQTSSLTWVDRLDCLACLERAFLWDSDSSSLTGVRYDLQHKQGQAWGTILNKKQAKATRKDEDDGRGSYEIDNCSGK